ncbi:tRNA pseudouridine(38-40) synthase TruA [bacterium]|nr:tRNA pseudouridine(38-40) synthase TruA [bacterium]
MAASQKMAMLVEYEGTHFHGWQLQERIVTVQQVIEQKLALITGHHTRVYGACRTDAGVHALAQVAHFSPECECNPQALLRGLNALLPDAVSIVEVITVPIEFHARYDARAKTYRYRIWNDRVEHPLLKRYCHSVFKSLDLNAMTGALKQLEGEHDFSAFRAASCAAKSPVRTLYQAELEQSGPLLTITLQGNSFLQHMVRIITGTLIEIGSGKRPAQDMTVLLEARDRTRSGQTAPAKGLALEHIRYERVTFDRGPRTIEINLRKNIAAHVD